MSDKYEWLTKKTPRAVDQLRLWPENPRLNPEESHIQLSDYAEDFTLEDSDKRHFFELVKSIVEDGFIQADPVVVWQNQENSKFYVAEGNRRILALKLLREPHKAPKSIRGFIQKQAEKINIQDIEKILVNVAPTFEDAEWYINQRNSASSLQRPWSRVQQQRWIAELYDKYNGDIEKISSITKMTQSELEGFIRILKIKDLIKEDEVKARLTPEEYAEAESIKFPITILERFFSKPEVREKWGIEYDGINIIIKSNRESFFNVFTDLILRIIYRESKYVNAPDKIDTRTITTNFDAIFNSFQTVSFENPTESNASVPISFVGKVVPNNNSEETNPTPQESERQRNELLKNNPDRPKLILSIYDLNTDSYRLKGLFEELKRMPYTYPNCLGASLRVFLDLAVYKYIEGENLESLISAQYKAALKDVTLKYRIEYIKINKLKGKPQLIAQKLIDPNHTYSLDVLNGFVHSQDAHYLSKQYLNRFWDFLFPFFQTILDIKEKND